MQDSFGEVIRDVAPRSEPHELQGLHKALSGALAGNESLTQSVEGVRKSMASGKGQSQELNAALDEADSVISEFVLRLGRSQAVLRGFIDIINGHLLVTKGA